MANYTYQKETGVTLQVIITSPNNIVPLRINDNVTHTGYYGVNGAFFYGKDQLSIAVNNDIPVNGVAGAYGSGWFNEKYARGTLVWDKVMRQYTIQTVGSASELKVSDRSQYWAQGGISLSLKDDDNWRSIAIAQNMPNMDGKTQRTALCYASTFNAYLIVTETPCTAAQFRDAIKWFDGGIIVDGIFLDGGGSTQMKCSNVSIDGDGRNVVQMVALISK